MKRFLLLYALSCYALFGAVFVWLIAFLLDFGDIRGAADTPPMRAAAINLALISAFGFAHSVMARASVKRIWTRIIPPAAERATYVLQSSLLLALIFWQWRPIPTPIWEVDGAAAVAIYAAFSVGAKLVLASTFLLGHFEFVGVSQAWDNLRGATPKPPVFRTPLLYRFVRHPLQLGLLVMMIATPVMTAGHLLFVIAMGLYIAIGLRFEERALLREFGPVYAQYRREVPMLFPRLLRRAGRHDAAESTAGITPRPD